ncbi:Dual specificity protein phosphatase 19 [Taenia crassiceps]|uniref:Dual specificity protein phosphatase 19 n=1 Tax=Taenia crassiceps TaxID=6207 RepID=A0ABR4QKG9_9CEST
MTNLIIYELRKNFVLLRILALNNSIKDFDQRLLRSTTVRVRTSDGRVLVTDRNSNIISTSTRSVNLNDDISRYGFIVNDEPDLEVGEVIVQGSQDVAEDFNTLQDKGITHIVNLISNYAGNKFEDRFEYLSCTLYDDMQADLMPAITACCSFIRERVLPSHGRLLIHCNVGISRAPSVLIGCLIKLYQMPFDVAYRTVDNARSISPNLSFKMQLRAISEEIVPRRTIE